MPVHSSGHHLRHERLLLLWPAMHDQRRGRPHGQAAIHRKRHVCRALEFSDRLAQRHRQSLPTIFSGCRQAEPAALGYFPERLLESIWSCDTAIFMAGATFEIADTIERLKDFLRQFCRFERTASLTSAEASLKSGKIIVPVDLKHIIEQEIDVFHGCFVDRHDVLSAR